MGTLFRFAIAFAIAMHVIGFRKETRLENSLEVVSDQGFIASNTSNAHRDATSPPRWIKKLNSVYVFTRGKTNKSHRGWTMLSSSIFKWSNMYHKDNKSGRMIWNFERVDKGRFTYATYAYSTKSNLSAAAIKEQLDGYSPGRPIIVGIYHIRDGNGRLLSIDGEPSYSQPVGVAGGDDGTGRQKWYAIKRHDEEKKYGVNSYMFANVWALNQGFADSARYLGLTEGGLVGVASQEGCFAGNSGRNCFWYIVEHLRAGLPSSQIGASLNGMKKANISVHGYWKLVMRVASKGRMDFNTGSKTTKGRVEDVEWSSRIAAAVSGGFSVGGVGVKTQVATEVGKRIAQESSQYFEVDQTSSLRMDITEKDVDKFLWQWWFDSVGPDATKISTATHNMCWTEKGSPPCLPGCHTTA